MTLPWRSVRLFLVVCIASAFSVVVLTPQSLSAESASECPSFERYANLSDAAVDGNSLLSADEKKIIKIDKNITKYELEQAFDCVMRIRREEIKKFFGEEDVAIDPDFYQFNFSDYAYGRILVNARHWGYYQDERTVAGMKVLKITFDFDPAGKVVVQDAFAAVAVSDRIVQFTEFQSGDYRESAKCGECHRVESGSPLIFKRRFAGFKFRSQ